MYQKLVMWREMGLRQTEYSNMQQREREQVKIVKSSVLRQRGQRPGRYWRCNPPFLHRDQQHFLASCRLCDHLYPHLVVLFRVLLRHSWQEQGLQQQRLLKVGAQREMREIAVPVRRRFRSSWDVLYCDKSVEDTTWRKVGVMRGEEQSHLVSRLFQRSEEEQAK